MINIINNVLFMLCVARPEGEGDKWWTLRKARWDLVWTPWNKGSPREGKGRKKPGVSFTGSAAAQQWWLSLWHLEVGIRYYSAVLQKFLLFLFFLVADFFLICWGRENLIHIHCRQLLPLLLTFNPMLRGPEPPKSTAATVSTNILYQNSWLPATRD